MASAVTRRFFVSSSLPISEYPLAVHLSGSFKTAFPDGRPGDQKTPAVADPNQLKDSKGTGEVVLVADSDLC